MDLRDDQYVLPRRRKRNPGYRWVEFEQIHLSAARRRIAYHARRRKGSVLLTPAELAETHPRAAFQLHAGNTDARLAYGWAARHYVTRHLRRLHPATPIAWMTLAAAAFTVPESDAAAFELARLQDWVRRVLRGYHFLGYVDASLYTNVGIISARANRVVSFHVHLLAWGGSPLSLRRLVKRVNLRVKTLVPGFRAAHLRFIKPEQVGALVLYALKMPAREYRIYPMRETVIDPETGEITTPMTGRFGQRKRDMRPCDLSRISRIMSGLYIDELGVAGGEGIALLNRVNDYALREFHAQNLVEAGDDGAASRP